MFTVDYYQDCPDVFMCISLHKCLMREVFSFLPLINSFPNYLLLMSQLQYLPPKINWVSIPSPIFFFKISSSFFIALIRMCNYALIFYQFNFCLPLYHVSPMRVKKVTCVPHRSTVYSTNIG